MKRILALSLILAAACATAPRGGSSTGSGALSISIEPNPIVAKHISGTVYEFPFDVIVRETGGRRVDVQRVTADVFALGGLKVDSDTYDRARMQKLGYPTSVPANGELRYHFAQRHEVPNARLFSSVRADLRIEAVDEAGGALMATTSVTVTH